MQDKDLKIIIQSIEQHNEAFTKSLDIDITPQDLKLECQIAFDYLNTLRFQCICHGAAFCITDEINDLLNEFRKILEYKPNYGVLKASIHYLSLKLKHINNMLRCGE